MIYQKKLKKRIIKNGCRGLERAFGLKPRTKKKYLSRVGLFGPLTFFLGEMSPFVTQIT
jgi:hypothetical protein